MQTIFNLQPFIGDAANAKDLGELFDIFSLDAALSSEFSKLRLTVRG